MTAAGASRAQRARGAARVTARVRGDASRIGDLAMSGSAKLLFPRGQGALQAVYLNSAGGITGGDRYRLEAAAEIGAHLTLTTQAAERVYRAQPGETGSMVTRLTVKQGARLDWLPQETILFDRAALDRRLTVDMAKDAQLTLCEPLIFGRAAMGETVRDLRLTDRIDVTVDGRLAFADRLRLHGDAHKALGRTHVAGGAGAMATVIHAAPGAARHRETLRGMLPETAGVSAISEDLLLCRILAVDGFVLRGHLSPVLRHLTGADLPRPWMI